MRHRKKKLTLSKTAGKRRELVRKLAVAFVAHGSLRTTEAKARYLRRFVEPLVTTAKGGDLAARRMVTAALGNRSAATELLRHAQRLRERTGGYTRTTKLPAARAGDNAPQVLIEFV